MLTTEFFCSFIINTPWPNKYSSNPPSPPNIAALLSPTGVRVKPEHTGGGCPVTAGELQPPGDDYIISHS